MTDQATTTGSNIPEGASDADLYAENLKSETQGLADRLADLRVGAANVPETIDESNEGDVTDFAGQIAKALKEAEKTRVEIKAPWFSRAKAVDKHFAGLVDPVKVAFDSLKTRLGTYQREKERVERERQERARREAEEAERKAREEAEASQREAERMAREASDNQARVDARRQLAEADEATARADKAAETKKVATRAASEPVQTRGSSGTTGFVRKNWIPKVFDYDSIPLEDLRKYLKPEHIDQALRRMIAAAADPSKLDVPGVSFVNDPSMQIRS